jgi:hypothetical protein
VLTGDADLPAHRRLAEGTEARMAGSKIKSIRCEWCDRAIITPDIPCYLADGPALRMLALHPQGNATCKCKLKAKGY